MMRRTILQPHERKRGVRTLSDYGLTDCYKFYKDKSKYKQFKSKFTSPAKSLILEQKLYKAICKDALKMIRHNLIYKSEVIRLPYLNDIYINKRKLPISSLIHKCKALVNWKISRQVKRRIMHLNEDRDYYMYRIMWNKRSVRIKHRTAYHFVPARDFKRELAKALKTNKSLDFPERFVNVVPKYNLPLQNKDKTLDRFGNVLFNKKV